jgi:Holliday junction resolvasome RuvABC endonuclease subunit
VPNKLLSIDPGLDGTGWALWDENWELGPHVSNAVPSKGHMEWNERAHYIATYLSELAKKETPCQVASEYPAFFQSAGGQTTAASGALVKLTYLVGCIGMAMYDLGYDLQLVSPTAWKGQLPKTVVEGRIRKIFPGWQPTRKASHEWDAVGIGAYALGVRL